MKTIKEVIEENKIKTDYVNLSKNKDNLWVISPRLEDDNDINRYNRQAHRLAHHLKENGLCRGFNRTRDIVGAYHFTEKERR